MLRTRARFGGDRYRPTISRTLSTNSGSLDNLNVWLRCGCKPNAAHIRRIVVWEKPVSAAIERIDQCVASTGVVRNVRSITAATWSAFLGRGRPGPLRASIILPQLGIASQKPSDSCGVRLGALPVCDPVWR